MKKLYILNSKRERIKPILFSISLVSFFLITVSCEKLLDFETTSNIVPPTVDEDPFLPSIEINGTLLHAESFGDIHNPIIIFLHGGPGCDYRAFISDIGSESASRYPEERINKNGGLSKLQDEYFCVFYDQRGAGLSPRFDKGEIDFDMYIEDLHGVINYFLAKKKELTGILESQVNVFAWSFGGVLATGFINKYPEKIKDVVFYEPGPFTPVARDYFIDRMTSVFGQIGDEWLENYLLSHEHISADSHERGDYQLLLGAFRSQPEFHQNPDCPLWRFGSFVSKENLDFINSDTYDISSNLALFEGKALFIAGGFTVAEFPDYMNIQQECYPNSQLLIIPDIGHTGVWEKSGNVANYIRSSLQ